MIEKTVQSGAHSERVSGGLELNEFIKDTLIIYTEGIWGGVWSFNEENEWK